MNNQTSKKYKFTAYHGSSVTPEELGDYCKFGVEENYFIDKEEFRENYPDGDIYITDITISFKTRKAGK